jgi:hypothetical protein
VEGFDDRAGDAVVPWVLDALAADCAADGVHEFWLTAAPLPITGAVGSPVNPNRCEVVA